MASPNSSFPISILDRRIRPPHILITSGEHIMTWLTILTVTLTLFIPPSANNFNGNEAETNSHSSPEDGLSVEQSRVRTGSVCPILMYDSDVGFGFGGKGIIKNLFYRDESFDLMIFGSSKGEQEYDLVFSIPDHQFRQGTSYPMSCDVQLEFKKVLKSNFFGFGNDSADNDWQFPKETAIVSVTVGRAFTPEIIGEFSIQYLHGSIYDFEENRVMTRSTPGGGESNTAMLACDIRWDTRTNCIHPENGTIAGFGIDLADTDFGSDYTFQRYRFELGRYIPAFIPRHVLAGRLWLHHVDGDCPYFKQSMLGGGNTMRGFKADRFVDTTMSLVSLESRFMVHYPLSIVLFVDSGRVYSGIDEITLKDWKIDTGFGLRYHLDDFIVRLDTGFSTEGTRIFFNFGHVF